MYWKLMFKTDRTAWKMHLSPSDLADRCFRVFCRWVILGKGVPKKKLLRMCWNMLLFWNFWNLTKFFVLGVLKKKSCSEYAETCSRFGIFEMTKIFVRGVPKKSCSECAETCSRFGIFEIWWFWSKSLTDAMKV